MESDNRIAVLIDADNVPSGYLKEMMEEVAKYGNPTIKRIYGDWTKPHLTRWKEPLLVNAITPIQQYAYTTGKNSTDSAMIIDAMDILYSSRVDGFCIVSSDSDFTRLATRLREAGMHVIGMGEKKTPDPFIAACDRFIYIEVLKGELENKTVSNPDDVRLTSVNSQADQITAKVVKLISNTVSDLADEEGWAFLGEVGNLLQKKQPNFDARNYGFQKLTPMICSIPNFEIETRMGPKRKGKLIFVRNKEK